MAHNTNTLAPWAEMVPDVGPMTVDEMLARPEDGEWQYELVDGRLMRMPGSGLEASLIAGELLTALNDFVRPARLGRVTGADGTFNLTHPGDPAETGLVPDVAFVRADRLPPRTSPDYAKAPHLAPDLVAEVSSPDQWRPEMAEKARRYLAAGVRLVWIIWPKRREVDVWRNDVAGVHQLVVTLKRGGALDGLDVLPGFSYPLADLFA